MRRMLALALLTALAGPAAAQVEPWRAPTDQPGAKPAENQARTTSSAAATAPTSAEQRQAKALATAIFAKPAAAQKAAEKAAPDQPPPDLAEVQPRPEWSAHKPGVDLGGRGVRVQAPF